MGETKVVQKGLGFFHILTLVFVFAKLFDKIDWPWIVVLSPSLVSLVFGIAIAVVVLLIYLLGVFLDR